MALQSFFTALFCCILFFHPNTTFNCFWRPRSRRSSSSSSSRRKNAPSSPPPSPPPTSASSHTEEPKSSKHKRNYMSHEKDKSNDQPHHLMPSHQSQPNNLSPFKPTNTVPSLLPGNHLVSELVDGEEPSLTVIQTIFQTGWTEEARNPTIEKVLKIHHSSEILKGFEDFREMLMSMTSKTTTSKRVKRWAADGNELLLFHCFSIACELGYGENSSMCELNKRCRVCDVIRCGFPSGVDKVAFCERSWRAHKMMVKGDGSPSSSSNGGSMVRRAMFVCRVIAGRVAYQQRQGLVNGEEGGFDSIVGRQKDLLVLNPKSVLPCFVVIYNA